MTKNQCDLRPIWCALLEIYDILVAICEKHNLRHFLTDGCAIGAVRHKGFIPWDDDLDVTMPRPDYERFLQIARSELPGYMKVVNWRNTAEFICSFGKIQDCRKERISEIEQKIGFQLSHGLFIDIFVLDGYPDSKFESSMNAIIGMMAHSVMRRFEQNFGSLSLKGKMAWLCGAVLSLAVPCKRRNSDFLKVTERRNRKYAYGETAEVGIAGNKPWMVRHYPYAWWNGTPVFFDFNGRKAPLPPGYDFYLRRDYGDYMQLPPEEKRKPSHEYASRCPWWLGPTN